MKNFILKTSIGCKNIENNSESEGKIQYVPRTFPGNYPGFPRSSVLNNSGITRNKNTIRECSGKCVSTSFAGGMSRSRGGITLIYFNPQSNNKSDS